MGWKQKARCLFLILIVFILFRLIQSDLKSTLWGAVVRKGGWGHYISNSFLEMVVYMDSRRIGSGDWLG